MNKKKFTYKKSGVNINAADRFVNFISKISSNKKGKKKFTNIGGFGSISSIPHNIRNPQIVRPLKKLKRRLIKRKKTTSLNLTKIAQRI